MKNIDEAVHQQILQKLGGSDAIVEKSFESIGPVIGRELKGKTNVIVVISLFAIAIYIAIAFIKVQKPIRPWQYSLASFFVLGHDILIPFGVFAILGKYYGVQITIPIIVALLTVIGYAINNVVVVFDRMKENILMRHFSSDDSDSFINLSNRSINQTLGRQINTSTATLLPLFAIYFFGGEVLKNFSLALILGIVAGLYSSIFLAIPIVYEWLRLKKKI
jgi:preprotein translocase subunit SecF